MTATTVRPLVDDWCFRPVPQGPGTPQLVCFPHAGGDVTAFSRLAGALAGDREVVAVRLPGRGGRFHDPVPPRFADLVAQVAAGIGPRLRPGAVFYGQSFGALLAYEVARTLPPVRLVVACAPAPGEWPATVPDPATGADRLLRECGLGDEIPAGHPLYPFMVRVLRTDLALCHTYRHRPAPRLDIAVHAVAAAGDTVVDPARVAGWAAVTTGPFTSSTVPGGHLPASPAADGPADLLRTLRRS
ncbi:alpha/beta fold hydrolase [Actinoplanes sp. NPDC051851]|uniref:thioesterase II family protein n=1 Tax=Actinoplanes sp. NPDC051851 TaxID=3154753 RepID=UPI0034307B1F